MSSVIEHLDPDTGDGEKEPRDALRRRQLIDATITCIADHGLSGTTVAKVAKIAGLSAGIVNFYFRTKDALLLATLEHVDGEFDLRQGQAIERAGEDPASRLDALVEVDFDPEVCDPRRVAIWSAFWGEALARDDYMRVCGEREAAQERRVVTLFQEIARRGGHDHLDTEALGSAFHHLLSSLPEAMLEDGETFDFERAKETCRGFLRSVFPAEFGAAAIGAKREAAKVRPATEEPLRESPQERAPLPAWIYHSPEFYELEKQYIFRRHWLLAGHTSEVPKAGDYLTLDVAGERAFVIRGRDGELRGFDNVCRHRASRVVTGESGSCPEAIVCPYHGWTYGLDGRLRAVPRQGTFPDLEISRMRLPEVQIEEWMGFVFVRFEGDGPGPAAFMREFEDEARPYRLAEMERCGSRTSELHAFNWKLFVENDAEGYHIPVGHPGFRRLFGSSYSDSNPEGAARGLTARARAALQVEESPVWSERMYQRLLPEVEHLPHDYRRAWIYYAIFPSAVLAIGPESVDCYQVLPVGPEQCRIQGFSVAPPEDSRRLRAARYLKDRINRTATREDLDFCAWTNEGIRSGRYEGGPLSELEDGVQRFRQRIRDLVPVSSRAQAPRPGAMAALNEQLAT